MTIAVHGAEAHTVHFEVFKASEVEDVQADRIGWNQIQIERDRGIVGVHHLSRAERRPGRIGDDVHVVGRSEEKVVVAVDEHVDSTFIEHEGARCRGERRRRGRVTPGGAEGLASEVHEPVTRARAGSGEVGDDFRGVIGVVIAIVTGAIVVRGTGIVIRCRRVSAAGHLVLVADAVGVGVRTFLLVPGDDTDIVDVELLSGHRQFLDVARQDDLTGDEPGIGVVGHEDIDASKGSAHVVDVVDEQAAVDAQILEPPIIDELELDLLHGADSGQVVDGGDVVQPQHLSVTGFRLGVHDVGGAEVGGPIDVHDVLEGKVDAVLGGHGHSRARDGDGAEGHQLVGELHIAAVHLVRSSAAVHAHILAVGVRAVRVIEVRDGHTDELARLRDGVGKVGARRHRNAANGPIENARRADVVEFGDAVADVHRSEGGQCETREIDGTVGDVDAGEVRHEDGDGLQDEDTEADRQRGQVGPRQEELSPSEVLDAAGHIAVCIDEVDSEGVDLVFPDAEVDGQQGLASVGVETGELDVESFQEGGVVHRRDVWSHCAGPTADAEVVEEQLLAAHAELVDVADEGNRAFESVSQTGAGDLDKDAADDGAVEGRQPPISVGADNSSRTVDRQVFEPALVAEGEADRVRFSHHRLDVEFGREVVGPQHIPEGRVFDTEEIEVGARNALQEVDVDGHAVAGDRESARGDCRGGTCRDVAVALSDRQGLEGGEDIAGRIAIRRVILRIVRDLSIVLHADVVDRELLSADFELLHVSGEDHGARLVSRMGGRGHGHRDAGRHVGRHGLQLAGEQGVAVDLEVLEAGSVEEVEAHLGDHGEGGHVIGGEDVVGPEEVSGSERGHRRIHDGRAIGHAEPVEELLEPEADGVLRGDGGARCAVGQHAEGHRVMREQGVAERVQGERR